MRCKIFSLLWILGGMILSGQQVEDASHYDFYKFGGETQISSLKLGGENRTFDLSWLNPI
jgi:hypothetical protein